MERPIVAIVDDDPAIRAALTRLVRSFGHRTTAFETAEDLLRALEAAAAFDCVITDIQMPGLSGINLLRALRESRPGLPVIMITAYPSSSHRERALMLGASAYLTKPFDAAELEHCLAEALRAA